MTGKGIESEATPICFVVLIDTPFSDNMLLLHFLVHTHGGEVLVLVLIVIQILRRRGLFFRPAQNRIDCYALLNRYCSICFLTFPNKKVHINCS